MTRTTLDQLYALTVPEIQKVFLETMQGIVDDVILFEMIKAIEANDAEALFRASGFTVAALSPILDRIEQSYTEGAITESSFWPKTIVTPLGSVRFRFNVRNIAVEKDLRDYSSNLVSKITEEARQNVRNVLEKGILEGSNPRKTALDIVGKINPATGSREGGVIGLTPSQLRWSENAERYLKNLDSKYFNLTLRDKRFDKTVLKAIESGKSLSATDIDKLVTSYRNKALKYRADTIARTETLQSINKGAAASYMQAINEGTLVRNQVKKEWDASSDLRTRLTHKSLESKYGKEKGIDLEDVFVSDSGSRLLFPGDISLQADASEIINCRCKLNYRVDWRYGQQI